jgi:TRAP-type C4-dicarboxylate transport system permease small subunit
VTVEDGTAAGAAPAVGEGGLAAVPRQILAFFDRVTTGMAYVAGALFIVLSFYITIDVVGRKFFHLSTAVSDEYGGYALALGGMWALAYTLRTGGHVRIDIVLPYLPRTLRSVLDYGALSFMALFAAVIAVYVWRLAIESFTMDARAMSFVRTPLFAPQGLMALGFTVLGVEAIVILAVGLVESIRLGRLAPLEIQGGGEAGEPQEAPPSL